VVPHTSSCSECGNSPWLSQCDISPMATVIVIPHCLAMVNVVPHLLAIINAVPYTPGYSQCGNAPLLTIDAVLYIPGYSQSDTSHPWIQSMWYCTSSYSQSVASHPWIQSMWYCTTRYSTSSYHRSHAKEYHRGIKETWDHKCRSLMDDISDGPTVIYRDISRLYGLWWRALMTSPTNTHCTLASQ